MTNAVEGVSPGWMDIWMDEWVARHLKSSSLSSLTLQQRGRRRRQRWRWQHVDDQRVGALRGGSDTVLGQKGNQEEGQIFFFEKK